MDTKVCPKCRVGKPATLEHFYRDASSPRGLSSWCKACQRDAPGLLAEPTPEDRARFFEKTCRDSEGHLVWTGAIEGSGKYGRVKYGGTPVPAHALALRLQGHDADGTPFDPRAYGKQPDGSIGLVVRHGNDCPTLCVEWRHLRVGTNRDNQLDRDDVLSDEDFLYSYFVKKTPNLNMRPARFQGLQEKGLALFVLTPEGHQLLEEMVSSHQ